MIDAGRRDIDRAIAGLAARLPAELEVLARVAYDYAWSWDPDGPDVFAAVDPERWIACGANPVRLLQEAATARLEAAAADGPLLERAAALDRRLGEHRAAPPSRDGGPVAYFCAEYAIHASLPVYSGGLGALAGDLVKEASDRALPFVAIGLLYRQGYFRQRIDLTGLAARVLARHRPRAAAGGADPRRGRRARDRHRPDPRRGDRRPDLARRRRPRPAAAARRRAPRELRLRPLDDVAALRRLAGGATQPICLARRRRPPRAGRAGHRARGHPPQRGPCRVRRAGGAGRDARGDRRAQPRAHGLHDAHAGAGGQRRLSGLRGRRAAGAADRGARPRRGRRPGARPHPSRGRARAVRDHPAGDPHVPGDQRGQPPPRRGRPRDVAGAVARPAAGRRADHPRDQRRARADVARAPDARAARRAPRRRLDHPRRRPADVGGRGRDPRRRRCWPCAASSAPRWSTSSASGSRATGSGVGRSGRSSRPARWPSTPTC